MQARLLHEYLHDTAVMAVYTLAAAAMLLPITASPERANNSCHCVRHNGAHSQPSAALQLAAKGGAMNTETRTSHTLTINFATPVQRKRCDPVTES